MRSLSSNVCSCSYFSPGLLRILCCHHRSSQWHSYYLNRFFRRSRHLQGTLMMRTSSATKMARSCPPARAPTPPPTPGTHPQLTGIHSRIEMCVRIEVAHAYVQPYIWTRHAWNSMCAFACIRMRGYLHCGGCAGRQVPVRRPMHAYIIVNITSYVHGRLVR